MLRVRLREEGPRPRRRWSELVVLCVMQGRRDERPRVQLLREIAERQTGLRYR